MRFGMHSESDSAHSTDELVHAHREEAEGASELAPAEPHPQHLPAPGTAGALGVRLGANALGVHGGQWIRSFDEAYVHCFTDICTSDCFD